MAKVGIDKIGFYTSHYYLDLKVLAEARGIEPDKYLVGLGQRKMSVPAPGEDIVTMSANAASQILQGEDLQQIDTLLFATETAVDQAKAAGTHLHRLLGMHPRCRTVELKQACYGATAALQMAVALVHQKPYKKVLIVCADISRYGLDKPGESTQGCGAVAMLVTVNPRILALEEEQGLYTEDIFDYWRPNHHDEGLIEGKFSTKMYLHALQESWAHYVEESGRQFSAHDYFVYHNSVPRLVEKAHKQLARTEFSDISEEKLNQQLEPGLHYGREIGNSYSAALYVSLVSLLDNEKKSLAGKRVGFYSYGSGCVGECFSGIIQKDYQKMMYTANHHAMLNSREALSYQQYEKFYQAGLIKNSVHVGDLGHYETGEFYFAGVENHQRIYKKKETVKKQLNEVATVFSPAKLIISGEHSVVYGRPAIAVAVNRFVKTTVEFDEEAQFSFDLFDIKYHKSVALQTLRDLKASLKRKYNKFLQGECTIRDVLKQPFHLVQFSAIHLIDHIAPRRIHGLKINTTSDIPVGCGMGSSAAVTLSVLRAIMQHYSLDFDQQRFLELAFESERLQHGYPSQLDLQVSFHGGCIYFHKGEIQPRPLSTIPMFLVNTGIPDATTGECVMQVAKNFGQDNIWDEFEKVTNALDQALQKNDLLKIQDLIRENHQLLAKIGVVPPKVCHFISALESIGAAGKICGAGSVRGEKGGVVLVITQCENQLAALCQQYDYNFEPVMMSAQGLRVA